jgi:hypothetical protein
MTKPWNELSEADRARIHRFIDSGGEDVGLSELESSSEPLRGAAAQFLRSMVRRYEGSIGHEIQATVVGELLTALARVLELARSPSGRVEHLGLGHFRLTLPDNEDEAQSRFSASGPVPARSFSEVAVGVSTLVREGPFEPMHHHNDPSHPHFDPLGTAQRILDSTQTLLRRSHEDYARNAQLQAKHFELLEALEGEKDKAHLARTVRELAARNAALIVAREPSEHRTLTLPFPDRTIDPGKSEDVRTLPKVLFRMRALRIAESCGDCMVEELRVGAVSVLHEVLPCPAGVFSDPALHVPLSIGMSVHALREKIGELLQKHPAEPGMTITLRIRNDGSEPVAFRAVAFGHAVR